MTDLPNFDAFWNALAAAGVDLGEPERGELTPVGRWLDRLQLWCENTAGRLDEALLPSEWQESFEELETLTRDVDRGIRTFEELMAWLNEE